MRGGPLAVHAGVHSKRQGKWLKKREEWKQQFVCNLHSFVMHVMIIMEYHHLYSFFEKAWFFSWESADHFFYLFIYIDISNWCTLHYDKSLLKALSPEPSERFAQKAKIDKTKTEEVEIIPWREDYMTIWITFKKSRCFSFPLPEKQVGFNILFSQLLFYICACPVWDEFG